MIPQRGALIILLDDDADFLELERKIFEARGHEVTSFSDPQAALTALASGLAAGRPALIVCDLMMAALDSGFSFARAVKADLRLRGIPIIIVSAIASQKGFDFHPRTAEDLAAMNADAFFDKPVQPQALLAKAEELLARERQR
jgi:CheY-like chemotaxis protein